MRARQEAEREHQEAQREYGIVRIAQKNELPDEMRNTYGASWARHQPIPMQQSRFSHQAVPRFACDTPTPDKVSLLPKLKHQVAAALGATGRMVASGATWRSGGKVASLPTLPTYQLEPRSDRLYPPERGLTGAYSSDNISGKLAGMFNDESMEMTALPWEKRIEPAPWEPTPPSKADLELQRQMCFSTAKVPWLGAKKAPKDSGLEMLVKALCSAIQETRAGRSSSSKAHDFEMPYNPHRASHNFAGMYRAQEATAEEKLRRQVLRALEKQPLCDVGELMACDPTTWHQISERLGGLSQGVAVRHALQFLETSAVRPVDRAVYHAASNTRQRTVDRGRMAYM